MHAIYLHSYMCIYIYMSKLNDKDFLHNSYCTYIDIYIYSTYQLVNIK